MGPKTPSRKEQEAPRAGQPGFGVGAGETPSSAFEVDSTSVVASGAAAAVGIQDDACVADLLSATVSPEKALQLKAVRRIASYSIQAEEDPTPVQGNISRTGIRAFDQEAEVAIINRLNEGDLWAWCRVTVTASYAGHSGQDTLGGASFLGAHEFDGSSVHQTMQDLAAANLLEALLEAGVELPGLDDPIPMSESDIVNDLVVDVLDRAETYQFDPTANSEDLVRESAGLYGYLVTDEMVAKATDLIREAREEDLSHIDEAEDENESLSFE